MNVASAGGKFHHLRVPVNISFSKNETNVEYRYIIFVINVIAWAITYVNTGALLILL